MLATQELTLEQRHLFQGAARQPSRMYGARRARLKRPLIYSGGTTQGWRTVGPRIGAELLEFFTGSLAASVVSRPAITSGGRTPGTYYPHSTRTSAWRNRKPCLSLHPELGIDPRIAMSLRPGQGIVEWNEQASAFSENLLGIEVGSAHDCPPAAIAYAKVPLAIWSFPG